MVLLVWQAAKAIGAHPIVGIDINPKKATSPLPLCPLMRSMK